jgi:hypothetical protein
MNIIAGICQSLCSLCRRCKVLGASGLDIEKCRVEILKSILKAQDFAIDVT